MRGQEKKSSAMLSQIICYNHSHALPPAQALDFIQVAAMTPAASPDPTKAQPSSFKYSLVSPSLMVPEGSALRNRVQGCLASPTLQTLEKCGISIAGQSSPDANIVVVHRRHKSLALRHLSSSLLRTRSRRGCPERDPPPSGS